MKIIDYERTRSEIIESIKKQKDIVLATSMNGHVTARTVYCVSKDLKIFFITSKAYTKYKQILKNPLVAMCFDNVQIEGSAYELGHPSIEENKELLQRCVQVSDAFMYWAKYKNTVLVEVDILRVELWKNGGREYFDAVNEKSYRIG